MQFAEHGRQKAINAGDEGQAGNRSDIGARRSHVAQGNQKCRERNNLFHANPLRRSLDGLHQSLEIADLGAGQGQQHRNGSQDVGQRHGDSCDEKCTGHGATGILDFVTHERSSFRSGEGVDEHRPEDHVTEMSARSHRPQGEGSCRAETMPGDCSHENDNASRNPHGHSSRVVQPLSDIQSQHVQQRSPAEHQE